MDKELFSDSSSFSRHFSDGLVRLLGEYSELGIFLLALSNALPDKMLWLRLGGLLEIKRTKLERLFSDQVPLQDDAQDDLLVFRQILQTPFRELRKVEQRKAGDWELAFNPFRLLRPRRASQLVLNGISKPFDPAGFHFSKPYLRKELLWQGVLEGESISLFYNKFPFLDYHCMLVPQIREGFSQLLTKTTHSGVWNICLALGENLPGLGFGYNCLGAGASVNHLHLQMFQHQAELPIEGAQWQHCGGTERYPVECYRYSSPDEVWRMIEQLHLKQQPYNLFYRPGCCYLIVRKPQHEEPAPDWSVGMGWSEMAGLFLLKDFDHFNQLQPEQLFSLLGRYRVD